MTSDAQKPTPEPKAGELEPKASTDHGERRPSTAGSFPRDQSDRSALVKAASGSRGKLRSRWLALPFGTTPLDSEAGRTFLHKRLALFSKVVCLLGGFALVSTQLIQLWTVGFAQWKYGWGLELLWQVLGVAASLVTWHLASRKTLSLRRLFILDGAGTLFVLEAYCLMGSWGARQAPERASLLMMLITLCIITLRAIAVPSSLPHTLVVSVVGSMPVLGLTYYAAARYAVDSDMTPLVNTAYMGVWVVLGITIAGIASQVIYGLRAQVAEAQRLGQYVLDELIGEGGMGVVYKASHALLRRPTAVKLVLPDRAGAHVLQRFEREVQLTAMLTHPNTVNIYDYGHTADGILYYAMEYLDGIDLEELVGQFGAQDYRRVAHILEQVAGSLGEAHGVGLVHRDVKPANVILCNRGGFPDVAKVVDFGLVKDINEMRGADPTLTNMNAIIGTPLYLAPEAIVSPDAVDGRSDLYALGAIGYFLLTGEPVFVGGAVIEICVQHVHGEPIPPSVRGGVTLPPAFEALILKCLAKKPEDRPQNAEAFLTELAAAAIPAWTRDEANAWWRRHAVQIKTHAKTKRSSRRPTGARDTLMVDFMNRIERARQQQP